MNPYLIIILTVLIGTYLLELIVETANLRHFQTELPPEFAGYYDPGKYAKSQAYLRDNTRFEIVTNSFFTPLTVAFILLGGFNLVDRFARSFHFGLIPTGLVDLSLIGCRKAAVASSWEMKPSSVMRLRT